MKIPHGFVYLNDIDPSILLDMKYFTNDNFLGTPVNGYKSPVCIITYEAAHKLSDIQKELKHQAKSLKVFDAYRPQTAVDHFVRWSEDAHDQKMKQRHYPRINKADFFNLGYVLKKSGHSRGSTVDLTIVNLPSSPDQVPTELDMGTIYDFMDETSHPLSTLVSKEAYENRMLLRNLMIQAGFKPIITEWWHFTLKNEPFPDTYFDFPVERSK